MKALKRIGKLLNRTGAIKFFFAYLIILLISGFILSLIEPQVHGIFEGFYFTFVASTTIGFGDIVPVTILRRADRRDGARRGGRVLYGIPEDQRKRNGIDLFGKAGAFAGAEQRGAHGAVRESEEVQRKEIGNIIQKPI